jgi:hypothetical protein
MWWFNQRGIDDENHMQTMFALRTNLCARCEAMGAVLTFWVFTRCPSHEWPMRKCFRTIRRFSSDPFAYVLGVGVAPTASRKDNIPLGGNPNSFQIAKCRRSSDRQGTEGPL